MGLTFWEYQRFLRLTEGVEWHEKALRDAAASLDFQVPEGFVVDAQDDMYLLRGVSDKYMFSVRGVGVMHEDLVFEDVVRDIVIEGRAFMHEEMNLFGGSSPLYYMGERGLLIRSCQLCFVGRREYDGVVDAMHMFKAFVCQPEPCSIYRVGNKRVS